MMGHKVNYFNYRVTVRPQDPNNFGFFRTSGIEQSHEEWIKDCKELERQINRHVDAVEDTQIEYDEELVCEFCGEYWAEKNDSPYNGGCCDDDIKILEEKENDQKKTDTDKTSGERKAAHR